LSYFYEYFSDQDLITTSGTCGFDQDLTKVFRGSDCDIQVLIAMKGPGHMILINLALGRMDLDWEGGVVLAF